VSPATPGEIEVTFESPKFSNCTPQVYIPAGLRIVDAKIVSYSGIHWTDYLGVNNNQVYNLSNYDPKYIRLGDPFIVQIPPNYLITGGQNNFSLKTGDDPIINTNCSKNNSFIYTALINSTISRSEVLPIKKGCNWTVESQSLINSSILIPSSYNGLKKCYYTNSTINCDGANCEDSQDAYDYEVYQIFKQLDSGNNGRILVSLTTDDLEVLVLTVNNLPYMWGPSIMHAEVWQ